MKNIMNPMLIIIICALVLVTIFIGVAIGVNKVSKASAQGLKDKQAGLLLDDTQFSGSAMKQAYRSGFLAQQVLDEEGKEKIETLRNRRK